ncbi:adenylosuccinate synthase, partial [Clostridium autoethanogenum]
PKALFEERDYLNDLGVDISPDSLIIRNRAQHIITTPTNLERINERNKGKQAIRTTKKGMRQCFTEKTERNGLRVRDFIPQKKFKKKKKKN